MATKTAVKKTTSQLQKQTVQADRAVATQAVKDITLMGAKKSRLMGANTGAPSVDLVGELNSINFKNMIGGPLQAVVDAQIASSMATVNFIKTVGFEDVETSTGTDPTKKQLVMVDFTYDKPNPNYKPEVKVDTNASPQVIAVPAVGTPMLHTELKVPLIALLQIPSMRIEHITIDFNVKLNSVETATKSDQFDAGMALNLKLAAGKVNLRVTSSYQRKTASSVEVKKEYSLTVSVKAVQDEMPAGLEKVLNLLGG